MSGFLMHVGATKEYVLDIIRQHGASAILHKWRGTDAEAIAAVEADPRDVFVFDASCDRRGSDGRCLGHGHAPAQREQLGEEGAREAPETIHSPRRKPSARGGHAQHGDSRDAGNVAEPQATPETGPRSSLPVAHPARVHQVYLCAAFSRQAAMRDVRALLRGSGINVTSRWLDMPAAAPTSIEDQARIAEVCLDDIHAADALIAFTESVGSAYYTGGRHVEVGIALASAVPVYVVGPIENVFHCHARVTRVATVREALTHLREELSR